jgi:hypothetical protein
MRLVFLMGFYAAALALAACAAPAPAAGVQGPIRTPQVSTFPLGQAYAATEINATIFRLEALASDNKFQYATYYDPTGQVVVARRALNGKEWDTRILPITGNIHDAHNDVVLGLSGDGVLHLSYDHHNQPLHYRSAADPADWAAFGPPQPMTGRLESRVTYPTFG